ncbi:MAG: lysine--tRNA ligase [Candidatus Saccharimonas sp.]
MQWLHTLIDEIIARQPEGEIIVSSGASPSGVYHFGHLREVITCDAIVLALQQRGRQAKHVHVVDDLDAFRKVPVTLPAEYEQYLGMPICDMPAPDDSPRSYAAYCFDPFNDSMKRLGIVADIVHSSERYRTGYYTPAIERSLERADRARQAIIDVSGRKLDPQWSPIQVMDNGRLKNRTFVSIDTTQKTLRYSKPDGETVDVSYDKGEVKLDWRLDWPGRWWLMGVSVEPFGRDHATKGGSYDTGVRIMQEVYDSVAPIPVPYEFINRTGDTKKMSASKGTGVNAHEVTDVLPAEVVRFFMLRSAPGKRLFFDETESLIRLIDDFARLLATPEKTAHDEELIRLSVRGSNEQTISRIPFSHLVASYQAALRDTERTLETLKRSEYHDVVEQESDIIRRELTFIARWLDMWAPEDSKFSLQESITPESFNEAETAFLSHLADDIAHAPAHADGAWFHNAIYQYKESSGLPPKELFSVIYRATIGKTSGPRAGWFLSILPREWLIARLRLER